MQTRKINIAQISKSADKKEAPLTKREKSATKFAKSATSLNSEEDEIIEKENFPPWLNSDGTEKDVAELKKLTESWGGSEWNDYVAFLDEKENEIRSSLLDPERFEELTHESYTTALSEFYSNDEYEYFRGQIDKLLPLLSRNQKRIIKARFWKQLTYDQIALDMGISVRSVRVQLDRGVAKLREALIDLITKSIEKGGRKK